MSIGRAEIEAGAGDIVAGLGTDAVFTPAGGDPVSLKVLPRMLDAVALDAVFPGGVLQTGRVFALRTADVADRPGQGDTIEVLAGGLAIPGVYPVLEDAVSKDALRIMWLVPVGDPE